MPQRGVRQGWEIRDLAGMWNGLGVRWGEKCSGVDREKQGARREEPGDSGVPAALWPGEFRFEVVDPAGLELRLDGLREKQRALIAHSGFGGTVEGRERVS
jgi:hypothetical protein